MEVISFNITDVKKNKDLLFELERLCYKTLYTELSMRDEDVIHVCYYKSIVIGACCVSMVSPGRRFFNEKTSVVPYLYNYFCDPGHRDKKPSVKLMLYMKDLLKEYKELNLHVDCDNEHAKKFYKKNNFVDVGNFKFYRMYTCVIHQNTF